VWSQRGAETNPVFNFFREVFLGPFSEEDTRLMLSDIARLMGKSFDDETLRGIHREAGGHPFLARQLASLVCRENSDISDFNCAMEFRTKTCGAALHSCRTSEELFRREPLA